MPSWKERKGFRKKGTFDLILEGGGGIYQMETSSWGGKSRYSSGQLERKKWELGWWCVNASCYQACLGTEMVSVYH